MHGVSVHSPYLAQLMRRSGIFSGKAHKSQVTVFGIERDENGFVTGVSEEFADRA